MLYLGQGTRGEGMTGKAHSTDKASGTISDSMYERFFNEAPDMFIVVDAESATIKLCNNTLCMTLGRTRDTIVGNDVDAIYHPDCYGEVKRVLRELLLEGQVFSEALQLLGSDGKPVPVSLHIAAVFDDSGEILESRCVLRNMALHQEVARLQLELRLQAAQKMESLALLAGGVAHDFNNLLVTIIGNAGLAALELPTESPVQPKLTDIQIAAKRAADLTKQLMAYSATGDQEKSAFDLTKVVREMSHLLEISLAEKAGLHYDLSNNPVPIMGEITQVRQIIMNLLTNSSDAIGDDSGLITIRTGIEDVSQGYLATTLMGSGLSPGRYGYVEISDTGGGITPREQEQMFDPFFSTKAKGHGLGLAAVLGIVRNHEGTLRVYSEHGSGTTIKILMPIVPQEDPPGVAPPRTRAPRGEHVMVVDDEEHVRVIAKRMLEHHGFEVATCADGREALAAYQASSKKIDVVLMDISMPHMGGVAAFKAIRECDPKARIVLMSGYNQPHAANALKGRAYAGFLQKPFEVLALLDVIINAVDH